MLTVEGGGDCSLRLGFSGFIVVVRWRCGGLTKVQPVRFSAGRDARAVEGARWYRWQGLAGVVREVCDGFFVLFGRARVWVSADDGTPFFGQAGVWISGQVRLAVWPEMESWLGLFGVQFS